MNKRKRWNRRWGFAILITALLLMVVAGLFFYYNFFRQTHGELVGTVPADASFILLINDNDDFVRSSAQMVPYLHQLLSLDALSGFESLLDKLSSHNQIVISSHHYANEEKLFFAVRMKEAAFKSLLNTIRIDQRDYVPFDDYNVYSYGTHYKKYYFIFHHNFFLASENIELLKKAVVQIKNPRNILSNKDFSSVYDELVKKNTQQNWLLIQNKYYFENVKHFFTDEKQSLCEYLKSVSPWCAFVMRLKNKEIFLSGYAPDNSEFFQQFNQQEAVSDIATQVIPYESIYYTAVKIPNPQLFLSNFTAKNQKPAVSSDFFSLILPSVTYSFQLAKDSLNMKYMVLKADTADTIFYAVKYTDSLEQQVEEVYKQYHFFKTKSLNFNVVLSFFYHENAMKYMMKYRDHYVFSDTTTSLRYYCDVMANRNISMHPLYKFSKNNIPTKNNFEICFLNSNDSQNNMLFSSQTRSWIHDLQIFSYSFSAPSRGFVPINVYLKFQ